MARHVSNLNGPSSGAFTSYMLQIRYVVICVLRPKKFFLQPHNIWPYRVVHKLPRTKFATYSLQKLLKMDHWVSKHVEPPNVMNKLNHKSLCILLDHIYIVRWYTIHTISLSQCPYIFSGTEVSFRTCRPKLMSRTFYGNTRKGNSTEGIKQCSSLWKNMKSPFS